MELDPTGIRMDTVIGLLILELDIFGSQDIPGVIYHTSVALGITLIPLAGDGFLVGAVRAFGEQDSGLIQSSFGIHHVDISRRVDRL
jgi:hypothetical protein